MFRVVTWASLIVFVLSALMTVISGDDGTYRLGSSELLWFVISIFSLVIFLAIALPKLEGKWHAQRYQVRLLYGMSTVGLIALFLLACLMYDTRLVWLSLVTWFSLLQVANRGNRILGSKTINAQEPGPL